MESTDASNSGESTKVARRDIADMPIAKFHIGIYSEVMRGGGVLSVACVARDYDVNTKEDIAVCIRRDSDWHAADLRISLVAIGKVMAMALSAGKPRVLIYTTAGTAARSTRPNDEFYKHWEERGWLVDSTVKKPEYFEEYRDIATTRKKLDANGILHEVLCPIPESIDYEWCDDMNAHAAWIEKVGEEETCDD